MEKCRKLARENGLMEIVCFRYQRMMRYGGGWHMERRMLLPGFIFLYGNKNAELNRYEDRKGALMVPCDPPYIKELCQEGNLIGMSKGVIRDGKMVVTSGPLKGREGLIRRIDRHKRTAEIEIPFADGDTRVTVGLEIYEKQM